MSAEVPPMSMPMRFAKPGALRRRSSRRRRPPPGPDSAVSTGVRRTVRALVTPPLDFISSSGAAMPCSVSALLEPLRHRPRPPA